MTPTRAEKIHQVVERRQFNITVILENVNDPHNIAAVMRTCDAIGIQEIFILNTHIAPYRKDRRRDTKSSSGACHWLDTHAFDNTERCIEAVRKTYKTLIATFIDSSAQDLYSIDWTESVALIFGNEHAGVSDEIRAYADSTMAIPQMGMLPSLNISVACAVTLYEALRQKRIAGHYHKGDALTDEQQALKDVWLAEK